MSWPMRSGEDRTVHARSADGAELVRYDRAGKWYVEHPPETLTPRRKVSVNEAVDIAVGWWHNGGTPFIGRLGGGMFDAKLRDRYRAGGA